MEENKKMSNHKLMVEARKRSAITGVLDVISFDANEVLLETEMGILTIRGDALHVNRLTLEKGEIDLDGTLDSFSYSDKKNHGEDSFLKRMFR
ncbi:MAG: sporulation protein YabP [Velocimicrobium sp.]